MEIEKITAKARGFAYNSEMVEKGFLFFALEGKRCDGHLFLEKVAENGGMGAVVSKEYEGEDFGLELIRVESPFATLQQLAKEKMAKSSATIVGVTGSVGKTTTREFIAALLEGSFCVGKTLQNYNSQIGFPFSILNLRGDEEVVILEMGMTEKGQIRKLVEIAPPHIAIITRIGMAHTEGFRDVEEIAEAKMEIVSDSKTRIVIQCEDNREFIVVNEKADEHTRDYLGTSPFRDIGFIGDRVQWGEELSPPIKLPFSASHLRENFLAACALARELGVSWEDIGRRARELQPYEKRFEQIERDGVTIINDCYNANPISMKAAFNNLPKVRGKRIAVLGEMVELGSFAEDAHREVGEHALEYVDQLLCYGEGWKSFAREEGIHFFDDFGMLKKVVFSTLEEGDLLLIKGSNSNKLWLLLDVSVPI